MSAFVKVAKTGDIAPGEGKMVETGGKRIAIFNIDGTFFAIDDTCTHRGGPLSEGMVVGTEVTCPWHGDSSRILCKHFSTVMLLAACRFCCGSKRDISVS